jgi:hypothetical protein
VKALWGVELWRMIRIRRTKLQDVIIESAARPFNLKKNVVLYFNTNLKNILYKIYLLNFPPVYLTAVDIESPILNIYSLKL